MLVNYRAPPCTCFKIQDGGVYFISNAGKNQDGTSRGVRGGLGGRGNRGRGRGGQYSGRGGCEEHSKEVIPGGEDYTHMVDNVNKEAHDYSANYTMTKSRSPTLPSKWLLLDSCYTPYLISTTHLLKKITKRGNLSR